MKFFGCKYCRTRRRIRQDKFHSLYAEIKKNNLILNTDKWGALSAVIPINYCPMCGRKLGD